MTAQTTGWRSGGWGLLLARASWLVFAVVMAGLVIMAVPARYQQLVTVSPAAATNVGQLLPAGAAAVARLGLSVGGYAAYLTAIEAVAAIVFFAVAALIFVGRSRDGLALLVATALILLVLILPLVTVLDVEGAAWRGPIRVLRVAAVGSLPLLLFLFPDGRFVPSWTRWLVLGWGLYVLATLAWPQLQAPLSFGQALRPDQILWISWDMLWAGAAVLSQVYRYNRVSTPMQRQQTKWVVFGFAVFFAAGSAGIALLIVAPFKIDNSLTVLARLAGPALILAGVAVLPLSIGISILRYRLWDIDIIIRRTLVYSVLTGLLALVYFVSVIGLQQVFGLLTGQSQSTLVTVLSTLAIAGLFVPLRARVQATIDQRLYRRKYDAVHTLAAFAANVRDETNLDHLTAHLTNVVDATMQPDQVSLWLRPVAGSANRGRRE
jgi:hypothetical protein